MRKEEENIDKVNQVFLEIEEHLLGFKLTGEKSLNLSSI